MDIEQLRTRLAKEVATVTFTKKNGDKRVMICTTKQDLLPGEPSKFVGPVSDSVVTVWDLESDGWRSFRFDSISSIETL
jgi:hypothetical protein